jgi:hypothetical protein
LDAMASEVLGELGHWRKPRSLADAREMAETIIDSMDPEWLIRFGLDLLGRQRPSNTWCIPGLRGADRQSGSTCPISSSCSRSTSSSLSLCLHNYSAT